MPDVNRRAARITLFKEQTINATAVVTSQWTTNEPYFNIAPGQKFALFVDGLSGSAPDIKIELLYWPGARGQGQQVAEVVVANLLAAPAVPYDSMSLDSRPAKSLQCRVTGNAGNGADTKVSLSLEMY